MSELTEFRQSKDKFMGHDHQSPLTEDQSKEFEGLKYFDENPDLQFVLDLEIIDPPEDIEMQTSTGEVAEFQRYGKVAFQVYGDEAQLTVYRDTHGHGFFLPFVDGTSGKDTYGAGRYLDVEALHDGKISVDFNYAYNPYCAYNESWSCPLTPFENRLQVPIRAGEKNFK